jgi:hypothetical protein
MGSSPQADARPLSAARDSTKFSPESDTWGRAGKLVGKVRNAHTPGDLWHLSIDDLFKPPGENPEPAGPGPFVINLSTSTASIPAPPARMPRFEGLRVYQLQRAQAGRRVQYRLRLGIIQSALEADAILERVREHYPGATRETIGDEDEAALAAAKAGEAAETRGAATKDTVPSAPAHAKHAEAARPATSKGQSAAPDKAAAKPPASALPDVPLEPVGNIRWDIDELLPDLPVTRPSKSSLPPGPPARTLSGASAKKSKPEAHESASSGGGARDSHARKGAGAPPRSPSAPHSSAGATSAGHAKTAARAASATSSSRSSAGSHGPASSSTSRAAAAPAKPAVPPKATARPPKKPSRDSLEATLDISATTAEITVEICLPALERTQEIAQIEISPPPPEPAPVPRAKRAREDDAPRTRPQPEIAAALPEFTLDIEEVLGAVPAVAAPEEAAVPAPRVDDVAATDSAQAVATQQLADAVRDLAAFAPPVVESAGLEASRPTTDAAQDVLAFAPPVDESVPAVAQVDAVLAAPAPAVESAAQTPANDAVDEIPHVDAPIPEAAKVEAPLAETAVDALLSASIEPASAVAASPQSEGHEAEPVLAAAPGAEPSGDDGNFDYDSNADTVEVEALVMIDAPIDLGDAPDVSPPEVASDATTPTSAASVSDSEVVFELEYLDPRVLEATPMLAQVPAIDAAGDSVSASPANVAESIDATAAAREPTAAAIDPVPESIEPASELTIEAAALTTATLGDQAGEAASALAIAAESSAEDAAPLATVAAEGADTLIEESAPDEVATVAAIAADEPPASLVAEPMAVAASDIDQPAATDAAEASDIESTSIVHSELAAAAPAVALDCSADVDGVREPAIDLDPLPIAQPVVDATPAEAPSAATPADAEPAEVEAQSSMAIETAAPTEATAVVTEATATETPATDAPVALEATPSDVPTVAAAAVAEAPATTDLDDGSVTIEAPIFWNDTPPVIEITTESAERELGPDSLTIEAPAFWRDTPLDENGARERSHASSVTLEVLTLSADAAPLVPALPDDTGSPTEAHEMAAIAARITAQLTEEALAQPAQPEVAESAPPLTPALDEVATPEVEGPTPSTELELSLVATAPVAEVDVPSDTPGTAAAPAPGESERKEDSQTLEVLVAKIGALIETAEAHTSAAPSPSVASEADLATPAPTVASPAATGPSAAATSRSAASSSAAARSTAETLRAPSPPAKRGPAQSMWPTASPTKESVRSGASPSKAASSRTAPKSPAAASPSTPAPFTATAAAPPARSVTAPPSAEGATPLTANGAGLSNAASAATPAIAAELEPPGFDSTQTIRALTPLELQDGQASKSYSIQLLLSEDPILPEQIPNLDIFEAYRLYVITGLFEERVMHALRLGFFSSDVAAEAVAGYLKAYFDKPDIKRVSLAEHDRFQERRVAARKDVGATGTHKSIELASRPPLPERRARVEVTAAKQSTPSLWSRLLKR